MCLCFSRPRGVSADMRDVEGTSLVQWFNACSRSNSTGQLLVWELIYRLMSRRKNKNMEEKETYKYQKREVSRSERSLQQIRSKNHKMK